MVGDLPDYTKYVSPQPTQPPTITGFGTKAETVTKESVAEFGNPSVVIDLDAPAIGKKTGLIMVVGSSELAGGVIDIYARQSGALAEVLRNIQIPANDSKILVFPCWVPTQDVGDGVNSNIEVRVVGVGCDCDVAGYVLYFEE